MQDHQQVLAAFGVGRDAQEAGAHPLRIPCVYCSDGVHEMRLLRLQEAYWEVEDCLLDTPAQRWMLKAHYPDRSCTEPKSHGLRNFFVGILGVPEVFRQEDLRQRISQEYQLPPHDGSAWHNGLTLGDLQSEGQAVQLIGRAQGGTHNEEVVSAGLRQPSREEDIVESSLAPQHELQNEEHTIGMANSNVGDGASQGEAASSTRVHPGANSNDQGAVPSSVDARPAVNSASVAAESEVHSSGNDAAVANRDLSVADAIVDREQAAEATPESVEILRANTTLQAELERLRRENELLLRFSESASQAPRTSKDGHIRRQKSSKSSSITCATAPSVVDVSAIQARYRSAVREKHELCQEATDLRSNLRVASEERDRYLTMLRNLYDQEQAATAGQAR
eukprot:gnl/MRDRNA2_/MRDRNA2_208665_c0_seq1.p1 gnl/MRDRNA2_/MRDRNA2_208665_c0~~gnl/MRDRNA2_/MRDRNA2_208665_c0_seq1.p1  ORF type:complete len:444 (+),score=93.02 gnl/MRDRNA2_/MRDRNA2_208665_c0_seq1:151-1332(+)